MHGCSDERGRTNGRMRLYICTIGFFRALGESHSAFHGMDHWPRYTPAFEVFFELRVPESVKHFSVLSYILWLL
jgi:hypothetical protein